jgi:hypothetical protein
MTSPYASYQCQRLTVRECYSISQIVASAARLRPTDARLYALSAHSGSLANARNDHVDYGSQKSERHEQRHRYRASHDNLLHGWDLSKSRSWRAIFLLIPNKAGLSEVVALFQ